MIRNKAIIATPPGATIKEQLLARHMTEEEFASRMDMSQKKISELIHGEIQLTETIALRLEEILGVPANFWNSLEKTYKEKLAKMEAFI